MAYIFKISGQELFFDIFSGPIMSDYSKRKQKIKYTNEVIEKAKTTIPKTVVIAGWWYNEIMITMIDKSVNKRIIYEAYIDEAKMNKYIRIFYFLFSF